MEETTLWLKELLFSSIADVAVLSADMYNEAIRIEVRVTTIGSECPDCARPPAPRVVTRWILSRPENLTELEQLLNLIG